VAYPVLSPDENGDSAGMKTGRVYRKSRNGKNSAGHHGEIGILLYSMLDTIVDNYFPVVDSIVDRVEDLETEIFEHYNQQAIESIFSLKKDLLGLRKVLAPERDVLNILVRRDLPIFDQQTLLYFQDLYDHIVRITDSVDTYRDLLSSALDSYLSMQSNRLNITVQTLTSLSIILMSVAGITGWYGMNFAVMPELQSPFGYPGVMLGVVLVVIAEVIFFKRKGWL
jgi:magnesium transporter